MNCEMLIYDKADKVAKITLNRPERMNALNHQLQQELAEAVGQAARDDDVRAVVVTGAGRGFCAGADFRYHEVREGTIAAAEAEEPRGRGGLKVGRIPDLLGKGVILGLHNMDKPTIAMVNGAAAGAGFDLALACDMRIGSEKARFIMSFTRIGVPPGEGGCWTLPRVVGLPKACEIIFTGDPIEAEEAYRIGLLNRLVPDERLEEETVALARRLAQGPPIAHRLEKLMIYKGLDSNLESALAFGSACVSIALESEDHVEGVAAFAEKRQPIFRGKQSQASRGLAKLTSQVMISVGKREDAGEEVRPPCKRMLIASCRPTSNLYDTWRRITDALKAKGVGVPMLGIEADMVNTRIYSDALVKDQIRAFMETVDATKRERGHR